MAYQSLCMCDACVWTRDWARNNNMPAFSEAEEYLMGRLPPRYPVPALYDKYPDAEYLIMLYQLDCLQRDIARYREETEAMLRDILDLPIPGPKQ